jgi:hypothetical protein
MTEVPELIPEGQQPVNEADLHPGQENLLRAIDPVAPKPHPLTGKALQDAEAILSQTQLLEMQTTLARVLAIVGGDHKQLHALQSRVSELERQVHSFTERLSSKMDKPSSELDKSPFMEPIEKPNPPSGGETQGAPDHAE